MLQRSLHDRAGLTLSHFDTVIKHFVDACKDCGVADDITQEARMILCATRPIFNPKVSALALMLAQVCMQLAFHASLRMISVCLSFLPVLETGSTSSPACMDKT